MRTTRKMLCILPLTVSLLFSGCVDTEDYVASPTGDAIESRVQASDVAGCHVYADPDRKGTHQRISLGETVWLADHGLKDKVSSIKLEDGYSLRYWGWNIDSRHARGIIYKTAKGYQSTNNLDLNPEHRLNTNDDFDAVRCEKFDDWQAILYADKDKKGGRVYLRPNQLVDLYDVDLKDKVSSLELRHGAELDYFTWHRSASSRGWIKRVTDSVYRSTAGDADNNPEHRLKTNDNFDVVRVSTPAQLAAIPAAMAYFAYSDLEHLRVQLASNGFSLEKRIYDVATDTLAFLAFNTEKKIAVLSFRGTRSIQNFATDANIQFRNVGSYRLAEGFAHAHDSVRERIDKAVNDLVDKYKLTKPSNLESFFVTGHSLGGALATYSGLHLFEKTLDQSNRQTIKSALQVVTLAAPASGDSKFREYYRNKATALELASVNYVNENDPIGTGKWSPISGVTLDMRPKGYVQPIDTFILSYSAGAAASHAATSYLASLAGSNEAHGDDATTTPSPYERNIDRPGADYRNVRDLTPDACNFECLRDGRCWSWSLVPPGMHDSVSVCYLKNELPTPRWHPGSVISGAKAAKTAMVLEANKDRPGHDYRNLDVPQPEACYSECALDLNCAAFTWVPGSGQGGRGTCYLKTRAAKAVENTGMYSGVKR